MTTDLPRRAVLIGAAAVPLAACGKSAETQATQTPAPGQPLAAAADVPVGSGIVADGTLITQVETGVFKGFVARCTHAGCALSTITDGEAVCPCHGSAFGLDGQVLRGPATTPLRSRPVVLRDGQIVVAEPGFA